MDWEQALKERLLEAQQEAAARGLRLSFSTEISLEEELNKSTNTDAKIIAISYLIMLLYASVALGATTLSLSDVYHHWGVVVVESKLGLGLVGIAIVLVSITSSIGLFSWAGLKATLIIVDVIPFIVLAVGVDNIFLIVHEFERVNISHVDEQVEERVARALGRMGPSILFSAVTETVSFALGAFVGMPAVRNFAVYAAVAVLINAILQVTMFVSFLTLNQQRVEAHKADILFCLSVPSARVQLNGRVSNGVRHFEPPRESYLQRLIRQYYTPAPPGEEGQGCRVCRLFRILRGRHCPPAVDRARAGPASRHSRRLVSHPLLQRSLRLLRRWATRLLCDQGVEFGRAQEPAGDLLAVPGL